MSNLKLNKNKSVLCFLIVPFMKPYLISLYNPINTLFHGWKFVSLLLIGFYFLKSGARMSKFTLCAISFCMIWGISMIFNSGTLGDSLQELISILFLCLLCDSFNLTRNKINDFIIIISNIARIHFLANTLTVFFNEKTRTSMDDPYSFWLGGDNYFAFILIPLCGIMFAADLFNEKQIKVNTWIFALIGWLGLVYRLAYTGMFAYGIFLLMVAFMNYQAIRNLFRFKNIVVVIVSFLVLQLAFNVSDFLEVILECIGKVGFNARDVIWTRAVECIKMRPVIGYGCLNESQVQSYMLYGAGHAHNIILEYLLDTGILGIVVVVYWYFQILKDIKYTYCNRTVRVLLFCLNAFWICGVFDFYIGLIYYYILLIVLYMTKEVILKEIGTQEKIAIVCCMDGEGFCENSGK